jgi:hypothetical protein
MADIFVDGSEQVSVASGSAPDVTALLADIGDASASTLGSLYAIIGNPSTDTLIASLVKIQSSRDFWSATAPTVTITGASTTVTIAETIVIPSGAEGIPSAAVIDCVHLMAKWRQTEDTSTSDNAYLVDVSVSALSGGDMIESITDISARVDAADTYDIQIINAQADGGNLILRDFQWALRVWWH